MSIFQLPDSCCACKEAATVAVYYDTGVKYYCESHAPSPRLVGYMDGFKAGMEAAALMAETYPSCRKACCNIPVEIAQSIREKNEE